MSQSMRDVLVAVTLQTRARSSPGAQMLVKFVPLSFSSKQPSSTLYKYTLHRGRPVSGQNVPRLNPSASPLSSFLGWVFLLLLLGSLQVLLLDVFPLTLRVHVSRWVPWIRAVSFGGESGFLILLGSCCPRLLSL